jgi:hypothetical protein
VSDDQEAKEREQDHDSDSLASAYVGACTVMACLVSAVKTESALRRITRLKEWETEKECCSVRMGR